MMHMNAIVTYRIEKGPITRALSPYSTLFYQFTPNQNSRISIRCTMVPPCKRNLCPCAYRIFLCYRIFSFVISSYPSSVRRNCFPVPQKKKKIQYIYYFFYCMFRYVPTYTFSRDIYPSNSLGVPHSNSTV